MAIKSFNVLNEQKHTIQQEVFSLINRKIKLSINGVNERKWDKFICREQSISCVCLKEDH